MEQQKKQIIELEKNEIQTQLKSDLQILKEKTGENPIYMLMMCTDRFYVYEVQDEKDMLSKVDDGDLIEKKALEIRLFSKEGETKWFRTSIGQAFQWRSRLDDSKEEYIDESQFLDVDDVRTEKEGKWTAENDWTVYATGGGTYSLPISSYKNAKIRIRNYLGYESYSGRVFIEDWRIVGFE